MTKTPDAHTDAPRPRPRHEGEGSVLPLAVRQRLWDQLWSRLLAPPVDPADWAPAPQRGTQVGGPR